MKLLLDTNIFLWYITDDARLGRATANAIQEESNDVFLSIVSVWEALVKHRLGKLPLPAPADEYLRERREHHEITRLGLEEAAVGHLLSLPRRSPRSFRSHADLPGAPPRHGAGDHRQANLPLSGQNPGDMSS